MLRGDGQALRGGGQADEVAAARRQGLPPRGLKVGTEWLVSPLLVRFTHDSIKKWSAKLSFLRIEFCYRKGRTAEMNFTKNQDF